MRALAGLWLLVMVSCALPAQVHQRLEAAAATIDAAHRVYGPLCAPEQLANAQADLDFTRVELAQGHVARARDHVEAAYSQALAALEASAECGGVDRDRDTVPDVVDRCPDRPEDLDGDLDRDGCPDAEPDPVLATEVAPGPAPRPAPVPPPPPEVEPPPEVPEPNVPEPQEVLEVAVPDRDADGVPDQQDACIDTPGDPADAGCPPPPDLDGDGIYDPDDRCIDQPETVNGHLDGDGCPDQPPVRIREAAGQLELAESIQFEPASAVIVEASYAMLDDVVAWLVADPDAGLRIEGHTDSAGSDAVNLELSQLRANSVLAYLVRAGIAPARLSALGLGEARPLDTNRTATGRANNRRVEFHVTR